MRYDRLNIYLLIILKYANIKQKILKKNAALLLLTNDSKEFLVDNKKRLDNTNMSMIFRSIMIVLMLLIFWIFINI